MYGAFEARWTSRGCEELGWLKQIKSASRRLPTVNLTLNYLNLIIFKLKHFELGIA
jgi:hypothetical protein